MTCEIEISGQHKAGYALVRHVANGMGYSVRVIGNLYFHYRYPCTAMPNGATGLFLGMKL